MKIAFNPSTVAALITPPNNKDITFDLRGRNIFARGVKFQGTDTWRDIKINNVSIGSNILDLRNGSNTTLTNTNGVVTINSTWRPVVDNLTSDSTTSSLSAKQGKVLKSLIDGKSNSGHTHDDRYLKLTGGTMQLGEGLKFHADENYFGTNSDARIISLLDNNGKVCDGGLIIDERGTFDGKEYVTELLRIRDSEFKWKGSNILHSGNSHINENTITINGSSLTVSKSDHTHAYLPLAGGTMTGSIKFNYNSLPQKTLSYVCGIDAFVDGGEMGWMRGSDFVVQYAPTKTGLGASGTWNINITGDADTVDGVHVIWGGSITKTNWLAAWENSNTIRCIAPTDVTVGNSDKVDGYHASSLVKFYLSPMTDNAPADSAKSWFINTMPYASGAIVYNVPGLEKTIIAGKSSGEFGHMLQLNYNDTYLRILRYRSASWQSTDWEKISAGYADSAGSVAWDNVTGKPSSYTPSAHTHDDRYIKKVGDMPTNAFDLIITPTNLDREHVIDPGGGIHVKAYTGTPFQLWLHDTSNVWYKKTSNGAWIKMDAGHADIASSATKLQTSRLLWGQPFDGTADISGTLSGVANIQFSTDNTYNIGSNSAASKYIYTYWLGAKSGQKLELGANNSSFGQGLCIDTNLNVGIGTNTPACKLDVKGDIRATGQIIREASGQLWVNGRKGALLRETTSTGYHTLWSLKTTNGSWDFGEYNETGWNNIPVLNYITDTDFSSGNNTPTYQIRFPLDSGTIALTKNIPTSLPANGGNADTVDGYHANGLLTALSNSDNGISITVGGTTKSVSNINVNGANTILGISPQIAAATEANSIYISSPGYDTDKPVKKLCFDWYGNYWALSNIRSGSTPSAGFGVFFKNTEIARFTSDGNIRATGNSYATHFYESSDKTLKKNIKSILSSTNIPKIREFDWKDTEEHSYGFIAQELEEQGYGCLVSEVNGKKTVNYTATLALTVAKLQNLINIQNKKISNLTKELKALKYGRKKNS